MSTDVEALELSFKLAYQGISPTLRRSMINNYPIIKKTLKKIDINITVNMVNKIAVLILSKVFDKLLSNHQLVAINQKEAMDIVLNGENQLKQEIEEILCVSINSEQVKNTLEILLSEMSLFNAPPQNLFESQPDQYNHILLEYEAIKKALGTLSIKTPLTTEKVHFIVISWFRYMAYAQDLESSVEEATENINELKHHIQTKTKALDTLISESKQIIEKCESIERLPYIGIKYEAKNIELYESQLLHYNELLNILSLKKGSPFSIYEVKKYAYLAMVFCALSLGLEPPAKGNNFDGNPIVDFLKIIQGLEKFLNVNSATCRASKNYNQFYKWLAKDANAKAHVEALLAFIRKNPNCHATWVTANKLFQSLLPEIITRPRFPITHPVVTHEEKPDM